MRSGRLRGDTVTPDELGLRLSRRDKLLLASQIHAELVKGTPEDEICDLLGLDRDAYGYARAFMLQERANAVRSLSSDQQFVDYKISQERNIKDLDDLIANLNEQTQYNALVGALRLRSEIQDKIVTRGQEFGVISKVPDRKEIVAGIVVAEMSTSDLRNLIAGQLSELRGMIEKFGDADIRALEPGQLHRGDPEPERDASSERHARGGKKSVNAKRHAGRRRVRDPK